MIVASTRCLLRWLGAGALALVLASAGCTGLAGPDSRAAPATSVAGAAPSVEPSVEPSVVPGGCGQTPLLSGAPPHWTGPASPPADLPYVVSREGNLVGVVFGHPLQAPPRSAERNNKILWIVREPRNGSDLRLTLSLAGRAGPPVTVSRPANSSPGEIYPSIVDVPAAGCWTVVAEWDGHRATLELAYGEAG